MVSFILCLLPALLATTSAQDVPAVTLTCNACSGTAESCKASTQTCPAVKATGGCNAVAEENTLEESKFTDFSRGCLIDYTSGIKDPVTLTVGNGKYFRINTARCNGADKCNSAVLDVPTGSTTQNGLQCPTCLSLSANTCDSQITPCTGDEKFCIDFAGTLTKGTAAATSFAAKGCATASVQGIKTGDTLDSAAYKFTFTNAISKVAETITPTTKPTPATTSGASPALGRFSFALYLPGLTGLLLLKLLA